MRRGVIFLLFCCSSVTHAAPTLTIKVREMTPGGGPGLLIDFSFDGVACQMSGADIKKNKKVEKTVCQQTLKELEVDLPEPIGPSDYISAQISSYEVQVKHNGKKWSRIVQQEQNTYCTVDGRCTLPAKPAPWRIVQTLKKTLSKK